MVTVAGAAATVTVIFLFLFSGSTTLYLPALANGYVNGWPAASTGELNGHVVQTTWCDAVSLFVHVTESPACTETAPDEKPALVMSTATVFDVRAGAGAATSKATAPANNMSLFIRISSPPGSRYLDRSSTAVMDPHGIAPGLQVTRPRLVRRHVGAIRGCALDVRSREDTPRVRAELQLLDRDPLTELRPALQIHRPAGERGARRELG